MPSATLSRQMETELNPMTDSTVSNASFVRPYHKLTDTIAGASERCTLLDIQRGALIN